MKDYLRSENVTDEVLILRGLPRTGKSTVLKHVTLDLPDEEASRTAIVILSEKDNWTISRRNSTGFTKRATSTFS